jgi:hypothetical protein
MLNTKPRFIFVYSLLYFFLAINSSTVTFASADIQVIPKSEARIDYNIRQSKVEIKYDQEVFIPSELFQIWKKLTETLDFEVGGGIDFDFSKTVERVKLSYGEEKSVAFLPDFEIGWHTHPESLGKGKLKALRPPSVEDVIISIAGNYNLWLILTQRIAKDFSNSLILKAYSEHVERLYTVEINIVTDSDGVYIFRANEEDWIDDWSDKKKLQKALLALKDSLQLDMNKCFIEAAENKLSVNEARIKLLTIYRDNAGLIITFYPWEEITKKGLKLHLNVIELLQHKRTRSKRS